MNEQKKQQVIALGRLGWSLRRIQKTTGVRRETAAAYLREAGSLYGHQVYGDVGTGRLALRDQLDAGPPPAKPAIGATTDFGAELATGRDSAKPIRMSGDHRRGTCHHRRPLGPRKTGHRGDHRLWRSAGGGSCAATAASASACAVHRDAIELGLSRGRNAMAIWQDLVDARGFIGGYQSVKRFVRKLLGGSSKEACAVIETAPGEETRSITAPAPWCATRTAASTAACACSC